MKFVVAIDGTAASGKGTIGKRIAEHFNFHYLDTGILYRIVAYNLQYNSDFSKISKQTVQTSLKLLNNKNFNIIDLRNEKITLKASEISKNKIVRDNLLFYQRDFALQSGGTVIDVRDIGSVVFKNASIKLYIDVDVNIRAKRRHKQLIDMGEKSIYPKILKEIKLRDKIDIKRKHSPLVVPNGAFLINNSGTFHLTIKDVNNLISKVI